MLKYDIDNNQLEKLLETDLKSENIFERYNLQKAILNSWDLFKNYIGFPSAYLIGQEIKPHLSTQDSIDIMAYNPDDSSLIVIELKRDKNKLQLLQALSYAGMVSTWDSETLVSKIQKEFNPDYEELIDLVESNEISNDIKIILVAENFDPEVIITSDWLCNNYSLDIFAFSLSLHKLNDETFLNIEQRYPLKELTDVYEIRSKKKKIIQNKKDIEWDEIIPKLKYSFGEKGIEICQKYKKGDPSRRRFGNILTNYDGFSWISLNFRQKYINVYLKGDFEGAQEFLQTKFKDKININTWRDGLSFIVENENQFEDLFNWLKLD